MTSPAVVHASRSVLKPVGQQSDVALIRAHALEMGRAHGLDSDALERLRIVVTETALNIVRHAGTGHVILRPLGELGSGSIEVLAVDKGPGISDMTRVMRDDGAPAGVAAPDG